MSDHVCMFAWCSGFGIRAYLSSVLWLPIVEVHCHCFLHQQPEEGPLTGAAHHFARAMHGANDTGGLLFEVPGKDLVGEVGQL